MVRSVLAIVWGFIAWFVVATVTNWVVRAVVPGYREVEPAMTFTPTMLILRLVVGALSSLGAGAAAASITKTPRSAGVASRILGLIMVALFIPRHYQLWASFPVWYHLTFLVTLFPLIAIGAKETAGVLERRHAAKPAAVR